MKKVAQEKSDYEAHISKLTEDYKNARQEGINVAIDDFIMNQVPEFQEDIFAFACSIPRDSPLYSFIPLCTEVEANDPAPEQTGAASTTNPSKVKDHTSEDPPKATKEEMDGANPENAPTDTYGGVDGTSPPDISTGAKGGYSDVRGKTLQRKRNQESSCISASVVSGSKAERGIKIDLRTELEQRSEERPGDISLSQDEAVTNFRSKETLLPTRFGKKHQSFPIKRCKLRETTSGKGIPLEAFDICFPEVGRSSSRNASLDEKNKGKLIEMERSMEITGQVLRPGMVLLKCYLRLSEQVQIVKKCQKLGIGRGGFYQPGYRGGAKLHLQMMCLGLDWDPQTRTYQNNRAVDDSEPNAIPHEFSSLVKRAIQDSLALMGKYEGVCNAEDLLPDMSPDICIVNFYTRGGRLGLHQDRDETEESLARGLPVVSFSVGDSAEFLYGDQRDVEKTAKVLLESGDVLIFGGKSRHIFHGVPLIVPNSAPLDLLEEAKLKPGRLNLTFRQF